MENKEFKIRNMLFLEDDRQKELKKENDIFIIKALFPKEKGNIARAISFMQNGLPANSFTDIDRFIFERQATIDEAIVKSPEWWGGADNCPDEDLLNTLFDDIITWTNNFQENLKKNKLGKRSVQG